ncbi:MAG: response regulator [Candidatus Accumulibacter sp.]|jgi:twitching motility two-component system response regulator PilH|nr:response regulator [Accumulibacter sp.]
MSFFRQIKSILNSDPSPVQEEPSPAQDEPVDRRTEKRSGHKGRRILVIDDSATVVATVGKFLRSAGCVVRGADNAEAGLEITRADQPHLVFLDIVLPGMNGFAALRRMRRDPRIHHIPVIIISGNEQAIEQFYAKRIGADAFMRKPFSRRDLFGQLETLIVNGKLPWLGMETGPRKPPAEIADPEAVPQEEKEAAQVSPPPDSISGLSMLDARRQLMLMGLQYSSQEQFSLAMQRKDRLAVKLFIVGRGIKV